MLTLPSFLYKKNNKTTKRHLASDLGALLRDAVEHNWQVVGATDHASVAGGKQLVTDPIEVPRNLPTILVVGNEGSGLSPTVLGACSIYVNIGSRWNDGSLHGDEDERDDEEIATTNAHYRSGGADAEGGQSKPCLATEIMLEKTDGGRSTPSLYSQGGALLPSIYADVRYIGAVIVSKAAERVTAVASMAVVAGRR